MARGERFDHEEARRLRAAGEKLSNIGAALGVSHTSVSRVCRGIHCPVDHRKDATRPGLEKAWAARRANRRHLTRPGRKPVPVPQWVPCDLREVYLRIGSSQGSFKAAAACRRLKAEATRP